VIAGENMDQARKFMEYLKSPATKRLLRENGYSVD
jgi:ABC-type molybdate transport system substrate-binding protein